MSSTAETWLININNLRVLETRTNIPLFFSISIIKFWGELNYIDTKVQVTRCSENDFPSVENNVCALCQAENGN